MAAILSKMIHKPGSSLIIAIYLLQDSGGRYIEKISIFSICRILKLISILKFNIDDFDTSHMTRNNGEFGGQYLSRV